METTTSVMLGVFVVFLAAAGARAEWCSYYNSAWDNGQMDCSTGCCGNKYDRYCCNYIWGAGTIAGTAIGCVVFVTVLVVIIVCCRRRRLAGQVIYTQQPGPGIAVINAGPNPMMQQYAAPPPYPGQPQYPPPAQY